MDIDALTDAWHAAADGFGDRLRGVDDWSLPTPCAEWDVRSLVNHVTRGNLNYAALLRGGSAAEFLRLRDADALGVDPFAAFDASVAVLTRAFDHPGAPDRSVDHPLGPLPGWRALGVRTVDTVIHTWDLARALGDDGPTDDALVRWADAHWDEVYAGVVHPSFFAPPTHDTVPEDGAVLDRILRRTGRSGAAP